MYVVATDNKARFQAVVRRDSNPEDMLGYIIRAVHGHSIELLDQMSNKDAHLQVRPVMCVHATYSELLPKIIGLDAPGLVPGGLKGARHIHCSDTMPDERIGNQHIVGFRGKGVDVMIAIDAPLMAEYGRPIFRSAAGVLLIPDPVPVLFIRWVQVLPAGLTIYKRPEEWRYDDVWPLQSIICPTCSAEWRLGQWICLKCWEPMTTRAVHDTFPRLNSKKDVSDEFWVRYGLTMTAFQKLNTAQNADLIALPCAARAPSALFQAGASAKAGSQVLAPTAKWTPPMRAHIAPPAAKAQGVPLVMTNALVQKLNRAAQRRGWLSHTDQYHNDAQYVQSCIRSSYPEWLRWDDGSYAPEDGSDNRD